MAPDPVTTPCSAQGVPPYGARLELDAVGMVYRPAEIRALQDVSFTVEPGAFCSLLGPSGCGKSTILMLAAGLFAPSEGSVLVDGTPPVEARSHVGFVFQKDALLPWLTALENVTLPFRMREARKRTPVSAGEGRTRALRLLRRAGLEGFEVRYPAELSGGMRQRVAICRALVLNPPLLLMDEPFGALDALTREQMGLELLRLWEDTGSTVLFVTHSVEEAILLSDQVVILSQRPGRVFREMSIKLPRPRDVRVRQSSQYLEYVDRARDCFYEMGYFQD